MLNTNLHVERFIGISYLFSLYLYDLPDINKFQHPHRQEIQMLAGKVIKGTSEKWMVVFQYVLYGDIATSEYCSGSSVFMLFVIGLVCIGSTSQLAVGMHSPSMGAEILKKRRGM